MVTVVFAVSVFVTVWLRFQSTFASETVDAVLKIDFNSSLSECPDIEAQSIQMHKDEVDELFTMAAMSNSTCVLDFSVTEEANTSACQDGVYTALIRIQYNKTDPHLCLPVACLNRYDFHNLTFFSETIEMLTITINDSSLCTPSPSSTTSNPSDNISDSLAMFVRDLIIVAACSGGGGALCVTIGVLIAIGVKYCIRARKRKRTWTLSGSDIDGQTFAPYNQSKENPMSPMNQPKHGREGPLPTPPPPDIDTIPSLQPKVPAPPTQPTPSMPSSNSGLQRVEARPPPPPPLPPVNASSSQSQRITPPSSNTRNVMLPSKNMDIPHTTNPRIPPPPPPIIPPPPPGLPPLNTASSNLHTTNFIEDIYDTGVGETDLGETDLHEKTKELENLLADMANYDDDEDCLDEYVELDPNRSQRQMKSSQLSDYVNLSRRVSFDVPGTQEQDEYVEMTASLRRDQHSVKFTSTEDMYI